MRGLMLVALVFGSLSTGMAISDSEQQPLVVMVAGHAELRNPALRKAVRVASDILREAGVAAEWKICARGGRSRYECLPNCDPSHLMIRILPSATPALAAPGTAMGIALPGEPGELGSNAYIYYDRVSRTADLNYCDTGRILGHVIAHEIGHLLGNQHSKSGIMRFDWGRSILVQMSRDYILFNRDEARRMRANVAARLLRMPGRGTDVQVLAEAAEARAFNSSRSPRLVTSR